MSSIATTGNTPARAAKANTRQAARKFRRFGQIGWVAKGVVYVLVGLLFIRVAVGGGTSGNQANQAGALDEVASTTFGTVLLAAMSIGLVLYITFRLFTIILPGDWMGKALLKRIGFTVSALAYVSLLVTAVGVLANRTSDPGSSEDRRVEDLVTRVLDMPVGRVLVTVGGLVVMGIGVVFIHTGWTGGFRESMSAGGHGIEGSAIDKLGTAGWIARGVAMIPIGFFLIQAAWTYNPEAAAGFDDSIRELASNLAGAVVASAVGVGFVAYGLFAGLSARYQRLEGPRNHG